MSYRWNAHETVASGAVSDSEATRPLQTGDNAPTLPFSAEFGYPFLFRARVRARCTGPHRGALRPKPRHSLAVEH